MGIKQAFTLFSGRGTEVCQPCLQEGWCWHEKTCRRTDRWWGNMHDLMIMYQQQAIEILCQHNYFLWNLWAIKVSFLIYFGAVSIDHYDALFFLWQVERVITIMQNPRQYKIPDWFLNRQKDIRDGKYSQV